ncbi:MAG: hypothetical protein U0800_07475 [Isosphaeraceae bacterium]
MGGFYGSVHVRSEDREAVQSALEAVSHDTKERFLLGPPLNGWIGVYPEGHGQDLQIAQHLAGRLGGEIVAMLVHDDDFLVYEYYRDGELIDEYNSMPDYFDEVSEYEVPEEGRKPRGHPEVLAHLAVDPYKFGSLVSKLVGEESRRVVFASELMEDLAAAIGIRNAVTSYEYLKNFDETDGIEAWDRFIHVPDLAEEVAK